MKITNEKLKAAYEFVCKEDERLQNQMDEAYDADDFMKGLTTELFFRENAIKHTKLLKALVYRGLMQPATHEGMLSIYNEMLEYEEGKYFDSKKHLEENPVDPKYDKILLDIQQQIYKKTFDIVEAFKRQDYEAILDLNIEIAELEHKSTEARLHFMLEEFERGESDED